ncbi:MAG: hypothetical protein HYS27_04105 [Deltaproteobacteria bacterium]|nr:hypothetical protein [Deltaproteobacteria bacterium]
MNPAVIIPILVVVGAFFIFVLGAAVMVKRFYLKVSPGQALINNKTGDTIAVSFTGGLVLPIVHRAEIMDTSVKLIEIERRGKEGLICKDNVRADVKVAFFVQVGHDAESVKRVASRIGCARASHVETLHQLFQAKFSEALKTVGYQMNFLQLYTDRSHFRKQIQEQIGTDLEGYQLTDVVIDFLEQTSLEALDPENMLDAEGIRAITKITKDKEVETNRLRNEAQMQIEQQNTAAQEVITKQDAMRKTVIAAREREAVVAQAREQADAQKEVAEQRLKMENARIKTEEELQIAQQNMQRQVEVAQKNRERVVGIETERVAKDRHLEAIAREREVELSRIEKEKLLEVQRKEIADVVRTRVAVERGVAEEEERIKAVRVVEEAKRMRDATLIGAETEAQQKLVKDIKAAEAAEKSAGHYAKQKLVNADADLEAADREARATVRRAEGTQAAAAAAGLAEVKVREADAVVAEKRGLIDAKVTKEQGMAAAAVQEAEANASWKKLEAAAKGEEARGLALAKAKQADADAEQKLLEAQAKGREAHAAAVEKLGLAEAVSIREKGHAEADATQNKMLAEADGIAKKMTAMKAMEGTAREHEEFRLRLENERVIRLQGLEIQAKIAAEQSRVLGEAFKNAKIDIVGGDGQFFDRFVNAVTLGKSIDAVVQKSDTASAIAEEYLNGGRSLPADLKDVLTRPSLDAGELKDLSVAALLAKLVSARGGAEKKKLEALMAKADELGLK